MPPRVARLATRLVYRTRLFGPTRRERSSSGGNAERIVEAFRSRTWFVRRVCSPPITHSSVDSPFQDDSCSTTTHDLLCIGDTSMSKDWFMTAAKDWPEVTEHLRTRSDSNRIPTRTLSLEELSESPFNIYVHRQRKGDLMILPPRRLDRPLYYILQLTICKASPKQFIEGSQQAFIGSV